jgi:hypothetical protein
VVGLKIPHISAGLRGATLLLAVTPLVAGSAIAPYVYTEAPRYDAQAALASGERFPDGARLMIAAAGAPRPLVSGLAASADAAVSFDGQRVLFAGRLRAGEPWQIFEVVIAGGTPRRVSSGNEDCVRPFYLPEDKFVYSRRTRHGFRIEIAPLAGGTPLRLSYAPGSQFATGVLADGRILFEAPHAASAGRDLFAVSSDGSGVEAIRCDHGGDRHDGRQLSSGDIVFQTGAALARFTSPRAVQIPLTLPQGQYLGPAAELPSGELLVAWRLAPGSPYALVRVRPGQAQTAPEPVTATGRGHSIQPVMARPHPVPPRHPSSLGDRNGANILCLDAYLSRDRKIPEGLIAAIRAIAIDDGGAEVTLGQTQVDQDGSFFLNLPSERPIRFELLDRSASVVRAQQSWFWMRRGEQRVCVGCHTGPERAPENAVPAVLLRTQDPVKMMLAGPAAAAPAPQQPAPPAKSTGQQPKPAAVPYGE